MAGEHSLRELLHGATHRVPGVPAHVERPPGHQGKELPRRTARQTAARDRPRPGAGAGAGARTGTGTRNHSSVRPPRVLVAWQRRIAEFFGQEV